MIPLVPRHLAPRKSSFMAGWAGLLGALLLLATTACDRQELIIVEDNNAPYYDQIPTIIINNYVNKVFIDLIGREPTDAELATETATLRAANLNTAARQTLIQKLQTDTTFVAGDTSYYYAYCHQLYEASKARLIEGASPDEISEELGILLFTLQLFAAEGDTSSAEYWRIKGEVHKLESLLNAEYLLRNKQMDIQQLMSLLIDNSVYDKINMNAFNYVNATFDNLLYRYPTEEEFWIVYGLIADGIPNQLFGQPITSEASYNMVLTTSSEFYEGLIIWAYQTLLARNPTTDETAQLLTELKNTHNFAVVQQHIIQTDEYANFD